MAYKSEKRCNCTAESKCKGLVLNYLSKESAVGSVLSELLARHDAIVDASNVFRALGEGVRVVAQLKIETSELPELESFLGGSGRVAVKSVYSHLAAAEDPASDSFTLGQIRMFQENAARISGAVGYRPMYHILNSAGIERFPEAQFDMVRLGIGLYGVNPIDNSIIHNVSTLKTTILQIRDVPQQDTVGYSRRGRLTRPSRIAAIPIGYADGLNRHLGCGNAYCLVNGQKAPYVGNICMDVCMIDVTDIDCREGDQAVIFGNDLPITALSDRLGTIPYEVLTSISTRVKRVYFQD